MGYQLLGPFVREGLPEQPLFLGVVKGMPRLVGKKKLHYKHRKPSFYLISVVQEGDTGNYPCPLKQSWPGYGSVGGWKRPTEK
jgi:hypothetical protein